MTSVRGSVLVVGGTGFIGRALILFLLSEGFRVTALAISGRSQKARLPEKTEGLDFIEVRTSGTSDIGQALKAKHFDGVINLAASGVLPEQRTAENLYDGNTALLLNILSALADLPPRIFIQTGSWFEYAPAQQPQLLGEDHSLLTRSLYGSAKVAALTKGAASAKALGIPFVCLRLFHVYGPGEAAHRLIPHMVKQLSRGRKVDLTGGEQARDFVFLGDVLGAYKAALLCPDVGKHPVYNVCTGMPRTLRQMCEAVADALGVSRQLLNFGALPYRDDETLWSVGAPTLIEETLGWKAQTSLKVGVTKTVEAITNKTRPA